MSEITVLFRRQRIVKELNSLGAVSLSPVTCTNPSDVKKRNQFALEEVRGQSSKLDWT